MNTTPDAGRQAVARLIVQARTNLQWSQAELATRANMGNKTIHNVENAAFPPRRASLTKLENALGLISGSLTDVLNHHDPASVTLDQIQGTTPATPLATVSDADLIWELTNRLQTRAARLDHGRRRDRSEPQKNPRDDGPHRPFSLFFAPIPCRGTRRPAVQATALRTSCRISG